MSNADYDSLYHCCRWCKWYRGGKCFNEAFKAQKDTIGTYKVAEDGRLSGVIEETLGSMKQDKAERELTLKLAEYNLSKKRVDEILALFRKVRSEFDTECKEALDNAISRLYQDDADSRADSYEGVEIADPHTFYCKEFF